MSSPTRAQVTARLRMLEENVSTLSLPMITLSNPVPLQFITHWTRRGH